MRDFFKGWRRKLGCIALVIACGLMAVWVMSYLSSSDLRLYGANLESNSGTVEFVISLPISDDVSRLLYWSIDYWLVVLPLTLLSAYLILWKPRPKIAIEAERPLR